MLPAKIIQTLVWVPGRVVLTLKFPLTCLKFSLIGFLLILFQVADAQKVVNTMDLPELNTFLKKNQKALGPAAVMVYKDDKVVFTTTNSDYFNAKTQAPIPGASKWFTAALVLVLVDEGKLKLDDPVSKYLPVMDKYMKSYITLRMCLAHTTGVESSKGTSFLAPPKKKYDALEDEINAYAAKEISNNAGEEFWYGNIGPNIAGRVLEVVTKKSFDRLAQEKLFRPLKMRATTFTNFDGKAISPATGAQTTAADMINFLSMILNKGMFDGKRVLSEASVAEMQKAQFTDKPVKFTPESTEGLHHGLGAWLQVEDAGGNGMVVGGLGTLGSYTYLDNCRKYAVVMLLQTPKETNKDLPKQFKDVIEGTMGNCKPN